MRGTEVELVKNPARLEQICLYFFYFLHFFFAFL